MHESEGPYLGAVLDERQLNHVALKVGHEDAREGAEEPRTRFRVAPGLHEADDAHERCGLSIRVRVLWRDGDEHNLDRRCWGAGDRGVL